MSKRWKSPNFFTITAISLIIIFLLLLAIGGWRFWMQESDVFDGSIKRSQVDVLNFIEIKKQEDIDKLEQAIRSNLEFLKDQSPSPSTEERTSLQAICYQIVKTLQDIKAIEIIDTENNTILYRLWENEAGQILTENNITPDSRFIYLQNQRANLGNNVEAIIYYSRVEINANTESLFAKFMDNYIRFEKQVKEKQQSLFVSNMSVLLVLALIFALSVILLLNALDKKIRQSNQKLEETLEQKQFYINELQETNTRLSDTLNTLRQTQKQLVESEKMASLGNLVAGLSHEVNTPLGVCITAASMTEHSLNTMMEKYHDDTLTLAQYEALMDAVLEGQKILLKNLSQSAKLIESFKAVSVDQMHEEKRKVELHSYLEEIILSLKPKFEKIGHTIECHCPADLFAITYPGVLAQIITNLVLNSLMHGFEERDFGEITITVSEQDEKLELLYEDNGKGADPQVLKNIFEPFFTTRKNKGGTGLGMHIIYNLITQKLNGTITCSSVPGEGIRFEIHFPKNL